MILRSSPSHRSGCASREQLVCSLIPSIGRQELRSVSRLLLDQCLLLSLVGAKSVLGSSMTFLRTSSDRPHLSLHLWCCHCCFTVSVPFHGYGLAVLAHFCEMLRRCCEMQGLSRFHLGGATKQLARTRFQNAVAIWSLMVVMSMCVCPWRDDIECMHRLRPLMLCCFSLESDLSA